MYKYHCLNPIATVGLDLFSSNYTKIDSMEESDAVLVRSASMHDIAMPKRLTAIARAGAGVNNIPVEQCAEQGIVVFNTPGANANGVKELVLAGMLLASRDILGGVEWIQSIKSEENVAQLVEKGKGKFAGKEIEGKKLGVIGLGAIGVLVANAANRLGMEVYGYDPFISIEHAWNLSRDIIHVKAVEDIYKECDFITVHVPLLPETKEMINRTTMSMMKDGVTILNFARDLLVNDDDMMEALKARKVSKYVTDFPNTKTCNMSGVITIPHLGASTAESEDNCAKMAVRQVMDYLQYGNIKNAVNYPNCDAGICATQGRITILHRNIPNMLTGFTSIFGDMNINIANLINKSKGDYAYSLFDIEAQSTEAMVERLSAIPGVLKVRMIK